MSSFWLIELVQVIFHATMLTGACKITCTKDPDLPRHLNNLKKTRSQKKKSSDLPLRKKAKG